MGWIIIVLLIVFVAPYSVYLVIREQKNKHIELAKEVLSNAKKYSDVFYRQFEVFFDFDEKLRISDEIDYFFRFVATLFVFSKKYPEDKEKEIIDIILNDIENFDEYVSRIEIYDSVAEDEMTPRLDWSPVDLPNITKSAFGRLYCAFGDIMYNSSLKTLYDYEEEPLLIKDISYVMSFSQTFKIGHFIYTDFCQKIHRVLRLS